MRDVVRLIQTGKMIKHLYENRCKEISNKYHLTKMKLIFSYSLRTTSPMIPRGISSNTVRFRNPMSANPLIPSSAGVISRVSKINATAA